MPANVKDRFYLNKKHHSESLQKAINEKKIDPLMIPISKFVAKTKNYFTTSTCSGRITLMELELDEAKRENAFYRKWHRIVRKKEAWNAIQNYEGKKNLWLRQDPFVFVIGTNTTENAKKIFRICQACGIKRYGIHYFEEGKFLIEVFGTQSMSVPVIEKGKIMVDEKYVHTLIDFANQKWKRNDSTLKRFCSALRNALPQAI